MQSHPPHERYSLPWIQVCPGAPYFQDETGKSWTPIGQNDAITWPDFAGAFRRRDLNSVEEHLKFLADHNVNCLRLMLEYCQTPHRYLEKPVGRFVPNMVRLWDDIFALCEKYGIRILLTPYDTFWMWIRWDRHPYNEINGGICDSRKRWLLEPRMRDAIKARLEFATQRWGGSGALFAWDIWNEVNPAHAQNSTAPFWDFVSEISGFLRATELRVHGRAHPQTMSTYGMASDFDAGMSPAIYRHPGLDFASVHFYERPAIDNPQNTVDSAVLVGAMTREALGEIRDNRPFFDSEHGPIHAFKDKKKTLSPAFDDEYFRHFQWAHFASGAVGGGMRWPNRHPHVLTHGMRAAQKSLADFLPLIQWNNFERRNLNCEVETDGANCAVFAAGDETQAIVWLLRLDVTAKNGMMPTAATPTTLKVKVPALRRGKYRVTAWNTKQGAPVAVGEAHSDGEWLRLETPAFATDLALAIQHIES